MVQNKEYKTENKDSETKEDFFKRKLNIFSTYYQQAKLYPVKIGFFCDLCHTGYEWCYTVFFEHKERAFKLNLCENCIAETSIKFKRVRSMKITLSNQLRQTQVLKQILCSFCGNRSDGVEIQNISICQHCAELERCYK